MIKNYNKLIDHGQVKLREDVLKIVQTGIEKANPEKGTYDLINLSGNILKIMNIKYNLKKVNRIFLIGTGKGSYSISKALENLLGNLICEGVVVVKNGDTRRLDRIEVIEAGHPIPDKYSIIGAKKILEITKKANKNDIILAAITGGSSALTTIPPENIKLEDIQKVNDLLLKSGAIISEINAVRKHLCLIKGGRLLQYAHPAEVVTFTLDTAPENMPWPDMVLPDPTTFEDAVDVLKKYKLWKTIPSSIRLYLQKSLKYPGLETLKTIKGIKSKIFFVGSPQKTCEAAAKKAEELGYKPVILSTNLEGEAKYLGICLAGITKEVIKYNRPFTLPCAIITGGEATVTVGNSEGIGGPNQEFVLAFADKMGIKRDFACVSIDTDGTDGPTNFAGGIVDGKSIETAMKMNINIPEILLQHMSSKALSKLRDIILTGHTGTNVMNLRVIIIV